ncbi:hypothetical protein Pla22_23210 [Rubripirellula amarantea]|uniref:Methyltransferase type 11 domain-containing protein n=1 Tax=Rubripirellula amarantea TaxID=2527999 RepID=A0A5C5WX45_9BACT|nr:class I SAM-dependent methyltransferase [Rubripirellula amarantea]TWT54671.1 hypothetical protein Pla22_23210 [Rubripirellula amarantea]
MKSKLVTNYEGDFYEGRRERTLHTCQAVWEILSNTIPIKSAVDFGCGTGTWLATGREHGVERTVGFEGLWVSDNLLDSPEIKLIRQDLEDRISTDESFDLAISLEVAEHLSPERADSFVADICGVAPCVLFGAAIPLQGGVDHVNEQWQSNWARRFMKHGYRPIDLVRPRIWNDSKIPFYYRQNTLFYANAEKYAAILGDAKDASNLMLDVVHPIHLERYASQELGTKESLKAMLCFPRTVWRSIRRRFVKMPYGQS